MIIYPLLYILFALAGAFFIGRRSRLGCNFCYCSINQRRAGMAVDTLEKAAFKRVVIGLIKAPKIIL